MSDDIKTVLTCQRKAKPSQQEPITNPKEIDRKVMEYFRSKFIFIPTKSADADEANQLEERGSLCCQFLLSHVRKLLGLQQIDDPIILSCLDGIAKKGKAKFIWIGPIRGINIHDMGFVVEVGRATRSWRGQNAPTITGVRFHRKRPMSKKKKKLQTILDVRARVEEIREKQDRRRRERRGIFSKETEIEEKLREMDQEATNEMDMKLSTIINEVKKN